MSTSIVEMQYQTGRIRESVNIMDVVGNYVRLRKAGREYTGLCPFRTEKTPSFFVDPDKGLYKCFGCGAGGDVFKFLQEVEGINFKEARALLAERVGITIADRPLTAAERRDFALRKDAAEWRDALVASLRAVRDRCFHTYHRARRFIVNHDFDDCERLRPGHFGLVMDLADTYWERVEDLDRRIQVLMEASSATLLPFFRARGEKARKAVAEHRADIQNAHEICAAVLMAITVKQSRDGNYPASNGETAS